MHKKKAIFVPIFYEKISSSFNICSHMRTFRKEFQKFRSINSANTNRLKQAAQCVIYKDQYAQVFFFYYNCKHDFICH